MGSGYRSRRRPESVSAGAALVALAVLVGCGGGGLKGRTPDEKALSAAALGVNGADENIPVLVKAIQTEPEIVQSSAIVALGRIGTKSAVAALSEFADSDVALIRRTVCQALQDVDPSAYDEAARVLVEIGQRALPRGAGEDPDHGTRRAAVTSLAVIRSPISSEFLIDRVKHDPDGELRNAAVKTLGRIKATSAVDALIEVYETDDEKNRSWAIEALGEIGDPRAVPTLTAALADYHGVTRGKAAWSLWQIEKQQAVPPVEQALAVEQDDMPAIVMAHVLALAGNADAVPFIEDRMQRAADNMARAEAARVLGEVGRRESVVALDRAYEQDRDGFVKREAALAIQKLFEEYPGSESLVAQPPGR